jgi:hypothetical protein
VKKRKPKVHFASVRFAGEGTLHLPGQATIILGDIPKVRRPWLDAKNAAGQELQRQWQAKADDIWRREPGLSLSAAARRIDPKRSDYIRKRIRKPAK